MKIEGKVTLTFVHSETGEVLDVREEDNIFCIGGWDWLFMDNYSNNVNNWLSRSENDAVRLITTPVVNGVYSMMRFDRDSLVNANPTSPEPGYPIITPETPTTPIIAEWRYRYTQPGAGAGARTIYGVAWGGTSEQHFAYAQLSPPCTQGELVVLFVNYRIQVFQGSASTGVGGFTRSADMREIILNAFMNGYNGRPFYAQTLWCPPIPDGYHNAGHVGNYATFNTIVQHGGTGDNSSDRNLTRKFWKNRFVHDLTKEEAIGILFGSHAYGYAGSYAGPDHRDVVWGPATPPNFPNKPIQPIHNHGPAAYYPFLEVTNLASGNGSFNVDGSAWTNPDFPMLGRVDVVGTGDVGVSRYFYRNRRHAGLVPYRVAGSYIASGYEMDVFAIIPWISKDLENNGLLSFPGGHGRDPDSSIEEWFDPTTPTDVNRVVVWDKDATGTGVTLLSLLDGTYEYFDATTTPALPVTGVNQVAVDDSGSIWVSSSGSGLWRIQDPRGTNGGVSPPGTVPPVITQMTTAMGLPNDTNCYAVAQGYNDSIWCIVEGGLCQTTNPTAPSPTFTNPAFVWTTNGGISNGNWSQVRVLRVNRQSPNNEMGIMYVNAGDTASRRAYWCWWDTTLGGGNATDGGNLYYALYSDGGAAPMGGFRVSRYGGIFCAVRNYTSSQSGQVRKFVYGSPTPILLHDASQGSQGRSDGTIGSGVVFYYDYYNKPYTLSNGSPGSQWALYDPYTSTLTPVERLVGGLHGMIDRKFAFERPENRRGGMTVKAGTYIDFGWNVSGSNDGIRGSRYGSRTYALDTPTASTYQGTDTGNNFTNLDSLNTKYSIAHEIMWENYRWNGASWVKDYNQVANEVSGTTFPPTVADGIRQNFETEDHTFYGRQRIDIKAAFPPGLWTTPVGTGQALTFACQITPQPKLAHQEAPRTIFSYYDPNNGWNYTLVWDDGAGNIVLFENAVPIGPFGPTPPDGAPYNVVLVLIDGGGPPGLAEVFVNGVSLAAGPLPLAAPAVDFSNAGGIAEAYIGCGREDMSSYDYAESHFFSGTIENVILDPVPWTVGVEVLAHNAAPLAYPGSGAQHARYPMALGAGAVPLVETKATHPTPDPLVDGLTITFSNGTSSPAFVDDDFYTYGICDGILKDNATAFRTEFDVFWKPVDYDFPDIEDTLNAPGPGTPTIPGSGSGGQITEKVAWRLSNVIIHTSLVGEISSRYTGSGQRSYASSFQTMSGDGYVEFKVPAGDSHFYLGLEVDEADNDAVWDASFYFERYNDPHEFRWNAKTQSTVHAQGTFTAGDTFKIERNGTDFIFYQNGTPVHTENGITSSDLMVKWSSVSSSGSGGGYRNETAYDVFINYDRPGLVLDLGKSLANTGKYNPLYVSVDELADAMEFNISGYGTTANVISDYENRYNTGTWAFPGPNEVVVVPDAGLVFFNTADAGKTVTCKYIVIRRD